MKAVLTFDLSDPDDELEYKRCNAASNAFRALSDIREWFRQQEKYHDKDYHEARCRISEVLEDNCIDLDELWS